MMDDYDDFDDWEVRIFSECHSGRSRASSGGPNWVGTRADHQIGYPLGNGCKYSSYIVPETHMLAFCDTGKNLWEECFGVKEDHKYFNLKFKEIMEGKNGKRR